MAKANLVLPNGTTVTVEGTIDDIQKLLSHYGADAIKEPASSGGHKLKAKKTSAAKEPTSQKGEPDIAEIINLIKNSDEAELIEKHILDRTSNVDRTLLPLYMVHQEMGNAFGLTSGDINRITTDLGIPIATPNIANTLSGPASRYVVGDKVRKRGIPVRYKLSRRGALYLKSVLTGKSHG